MGELALIQRERENVLRFIDSESIRQDYYTQWIETLDVNKNVSRETYRKAIGVFRDYLGENARPTEQDIIRYREYMQEIGRKNTTIAKNLLAVKLFFRWTEKQGLYSDVARDVKSVKVSKLHKKRALTKDEVQRVLAAIDRTTLTGKRDFAMMTLMLSTGLRTIEVSQSNISDVQDIGGAYTALFVAGKWRNANEKTEFVKVPTKVLAEIKTYLDARTIETGQYDENAPLFVGHANRISGERLTTESISRICKTHFRAAGIDSEKATAHSTRHTFATSLIKSGVSLLEVTKLLRQSDPKTTLIYVHEQEIENSDGTERVASMYDW